MSNNFNADEKFSLEHAQEIGKILDAYKVSQETDRIRIRLVNQEEKRTLSLEIFPETSLGKSRGMLVVIYTGNSHLQLHNCTGYVTSDELGEVTFVSERDNNLSGVVVERGASCSLYASIDRELISSDFTQLGVEVMLSGVAMSLAEDVLSKNQKK